MSFGSRSLVSKYLQFIIHSQLTLIDKWRVIMRASLNNSYVSFVSAASTVPKQYNFVMNIVSSNRITDL